MKLDDVVEVNLVDRSPKKHIYRSVKWLRKLLRKMLKSEFTTELRERFSKI